MDVQGYRDARQTCAEGGRDFVYRHIELLGQQQECGAGKRQ